MEITSLSELWEKYSLAFFFSRMTPKFRVSTVMHDHSQTVNFLTMFEKKKREFFFSNMTQKFRFSTVMPQVNFLTKL